MRTTISGRELTDLLRGIPGATSRRTHQPADRCDNRCPHLGRPFQWRSTTSSNCRTKSPAMSSGRSSRGSVSRKSSGRPANQPTASTPTICTCAPVAQFHRFTAEGMRQAIALLQRALVIDPPYAPAAALIGFCHKKGVKGFNKKRAAVAAPDRPDGSTTLGRSSRSPRCRETGRADPRRQPETYCGGRIGRNPAPRRSPRRRRSRRGQT
jgi:hypothetical protein